ncbi:YCF48-related protein [Teredinibacter franksiae]|uniref:YCF48-related protein n=1 Tax=Teredinibacter franksiae TaxID=2761453 RepID=UPI0016247BB4|nr:YCF48-related protein [Teredinibacter franksiae]
MGFIITVFGRCTIALTLALFLCACDMRASERNISAQGVFVVNPDYVGGIYDSEVDQYILWGSDGVISRSRDGVNWRQASGETPSTIRHIAVSGSQLLAVGDKNTLLESTDAGSTWVRVEQPSGSANYLVALIRRNGDKIIADSKGHIFLKALGVEEWQEVSIAASAITALAEHSDTLIASGENGFLATSKNGVKWQNVDTRLETSISHIIVGNTRVLALAAQGYFLLSNDGGNSWQAFHSEVSAPFSAAAFSADESVLVIAAQNGQTVFTDFENDSWQQGEVKFGGEALGVSDIIYDSEQKRFVAAGHSGLFAYSLDDGVSWVTERVNNSFGGQNLLFNPRLKQLVSYGKGGELHITSSTAYNWKTIQQNLAGYYRISHSLPRHWLAFGTVGEVVTAKHTIEGAYSGRAVVPWVSQAVDYPNKTTPPYYRSLLVLPNQHLLAAGPTGAIMRSVDEGLNWHPVLWTPFENNEAFTQLLYNPFNSTVLAVEADGRFYISANNGEAWQARLVETPYRLWQADVNPATGAVVVVGQNGQTAVYQADTNSWHDYKIPDAPDLYACFFSQASQAFFLAGEGGALYSGSANGKHWKRIDTEMKTALRGISETPSGHLLSFGQQQTILRKPSHADDWEVVHIGGRGELRALHRHPRTGELFIVGSHGLLLLSKDEGLTWENIPLNTHAGFRGLAVNGNRLLLSGERLVLVDY